MKTYRIGLTYIEGVVLEIKAPTQTMAENLALEELDNGIPEDADIVHRDFFVSHVESIN